MIFLNPHMEWIEKDHLPVFELEQKENDTDQGTGFDFPDIEGEKLSVAVEKFEAHLIQQTLEKHHFNRTKTAKALGVSIRNLYYKMDKYGLQMKACNNLQNKRKHLHECFNISGMTAPLRVGTELA
nr:helix-turn-helix domain-containing protein [Bacillus subtilis]